MRKLHRRRLGFAGAALSLLLASACVTPTPYQPLTGREGGYLSQRIAANRYRVTFAGNSITSRERVETYLLFRAAELAVEQGFDGFTIEDRATDRDVETRVYRDPFGYGPYRYWRPWYRYSGRSFGWRRWDPWYGDPFWADEINVQTVQRFEANAEIVLFRGRRDDPKSFNAREVIDNLGPTIELPRERR